MIDAASGRRLSRSLVIHRDSPSSQHKKLPEKESGSSSSGVSSPALRGNGSLSSMSSSMGSGTGEESDEDDMLNSVCNGRMYIEDPVNKVRIV